MIKVLDTPIPGLLVLEPVVHGDARGYFCETYNERDLADVLPGVRFVQDNESLSRYGVVRGLHFQRAPHAQAKLVRVALGAVYDVAVDLRPGSPTYGHWYGVELSAENHLQLFIPKGFAHGFSVLSEKVLFQYKCDDFYAPEAEAAIAWDDPDLGIDWKIPAGEVILSEKDRHHPRLSELK